MGTGEQGVPLGFLCTANQSAAIIWGHMTHTWIFSQVMQEHPKMAGMPTQFEVLPPLEEWQIDLEVGSQVYQLLKGFKLLWKATPQPDTTSSLYMGGF